MTRAVSAFPPHSASDIEALPGLPSPPFPALSCVVSGLRSPAAGISASLDYSQSDSDWKFSDLCPPGPILLRNAVVRDGEVFEVLSVSPRAFERWEMLAVCLSRNLVSLGENCFRVCLCLQIVAFESDSHLREIGSEAFAVCHFLLSIAVPAFVSLLASECFSFCESLRSVSFEVPSRLATIDSWAFRFCRSLARLLIPASVTTIHGRAFEQSGVRSISIENGSVSFRVWGDLLVDFDVHLLVWVIGSPDSIVIPSSIEELGAYCCAFKARPRNVEFESGSNLRSIGRFAFCRSESLESISIPSSVEVLWDGCFSSCPRLGPVIFAPDSKLREIRDGAFDRCRSVDLISVPESAQVIGS
jgi:hypothetical protein